MNTHTNTREIAAHHLTAILQCETSPSTGRTVCYQGACRAAPLDKWKEWHERRYPIRPFRRSLRITISIVIHNDKTDERCSPATPSDMLGRRKRVSRGTQRKWVDARSRSRSCSLLFRDFHHHRRCANPSCIAWPTPPVLARNARPFPPFEAWRAWLALPPTF
jgi:hypothetical protein